MRQARSMPTFDDLRATMDAQAARLAKRSEMGNAVAYIRFRWDGLARFADDGRIDMDTNPADNPIRPLALTRKNALFARHDKGGWTSARIVSLIETCRLNDIEPYAYLRATLEPVARGHPADEIDALMPRAFDQDTV